MNCATRKVRSTAKGVWRTKSHDTMRTRSKARKKPVAGESTMAAVVLARPPQTIAPRPALATPAPTSPPISAWEEDDGMPPIQVMMFQLMAPVRAANTTAGVTVSALMMPLPSVSATCRPKNRKAMKLKKAAQNTAKCGLSTRVETIVAIEVAASCSPFRKSKKRATAIRPTSSGKASETSIGRSDVLYDDAGNFVGHVLEAIDHFLELTVDLRADHVGHGISAAVPREQVLEALFMQFVGPVFHLRDLPGQGGELRRVGVHLGQERNSLGDEMGRVDNPFPHFMHQRVEFRPVEQANRLDGLVHHVDGIVHRLDQVLDVAAVERSDEGATRGQEHFGSHDVRLLLQLHD